MRKRALSCIAVVVFSLAMVRIHAGSLGFRPSESNAAIGESIIPDARRPIDLVVCLDTSGSMTQLIDSARGRLWEIVNELAKAKPTPRLRVGVFTYGSPNLSTAEHGWVVRQLDLTDDLDAVYASMMAMTTNGGEEYVGWVLNDAVQTMSWSTDKNALRIIFVAGNESADQAAARHNFRTVAEAAVRKGIVINAIYAGNREQGVAEHWADVAEYGHGTFASIDMNQGTIQIPTPQDPVLLKLNAELNATYVTFGSRGRAYQMNQLEQDANAAKLGAQSSSSRVVAKGGGLYVNAKWDLVDASNQEDFRLEDVAEDELPEKMRDMTPKQRQAYVDGMKTAREAIQKKIRKASAKRAAFLAEAERKAQNDGKTSLDDAIRSAIRKQAGAKGFAFNSQSKAPAAEAGHGN